MRKLFVRLLLVSFGLLLAAGGAELGLRLFPGLLSEDARLRLHWAGLGASDSNTVAHPTIGYVARSGPDKLERTDLSFTFDIDPNGFRNDWPWPEQADLVVAGDSLAFSYGVEKDESWTDALVTKHPGLSLVNLGIVGGAPQMAERAFDAYGAKLSPKLFVFGLFLGNDVYDAEKFDAWSRNNGGEENFGLWKAFGGRPPGWQGKLYKLAKYSYLFTALQDFKRQSNRPPATLELDGGGRVQLVPDTIGSGFVKRGSKKFTLIEAAVHAGLERARSVGAEMVVLFFPTKEEVYMPLTVDDPPDLSTPFREALEKHGIPTIHPLEALRERAKQGEQVYFEIDGHPNAAGYAVIAEVVDAYLVENAERLGLKL